MTEPHFPAPYRVWFRPNAAYLAFLALCVFALGSGFTFGGLIGVVVTVSGGLLVVMLAAPILVSTVFRVPVLVIDRDGLRLPLMGVQLSWPEIIRVRQAIEPKRAAVLIVPADGSAVVRQMWPWLRAEGRANLARYGTPIVLTSASMSRTIGETYPVIARWHPVSVADPAHPTSSTKPDIR
jgi:hypothetical protein